MFAAVAGVIASKAPGGISVAGPFVPMPVMVTESPNTYRVPATAFMSVGVTQSPNGATGQVVTMMPVGLSPTPNAGEVLTTQPAPIALAGTPSAGVMQNVASMPVGLNAITTPLIVNFNTQPFADSSIYNEPMTTMVGGGSGQSITMVPGLFGNAASFSGGDHRVGTVNAIPLSGNFIMEGWVNFSSIHSTQQRYFLYIFRHGQSSDVALTLRPGGIIRANFVGQLVDSSVAVTTNQWYHICFTRLNGLLYLMIDGVIVGTGASTFAGGYDTGTVGSRIWLGGTLLNDGIGISAFSHHGLMDSWRFVNGTGRNANFTPPTAEY